MSALVARLLRWVAGRLDPVEDEVVGLAPSELLALRELRRPEPISEPLDVHGLWRESSTDYAAYVDDGDEWRSGVYL